MVDSPELRRAKILARFGRTKEAIANLELAILQRPSDESLRKALYELRQRRLSVRVGIVAHAVLDSVYRLMLAVVVAVAASAFAFLSGFFSGSAQGALFFAAFSVFFGAGWSLLPVIRVSKVCAVLALLGWGLLAMPLAFFGAQSVRGWMLMPWLLASAFLGACLAFRPPKFTKPADPFDINASCDGRGDDV